MRFTSLFRLAQRATAARLPSSLLCSGVIFANRLAPKKLNRLDRAKRPRMLRNFGFGQHLFAMRTSDRLQFCHLQQAGGMRDKLAVGIRLSHTGQLLRCPGERSPTARPWRSSPAGSGAAKPASAPVRTEMQVIEKAARQPQIETPTAADWSQHCRLKRIDCASETDEDDSALQPKLQRIVWCSSLKLQQERTRSRRQT